jgi:hypothetical protein
MAFDLATALQGFGAGVGGRGQQFLRKLEDDRKLSLLEDAFTAREHLLNGNPQGAMGLLDNRLQTMPQIDPNADMSDTVGMRDMIASGDIQGAINELSIPLNFAASQGLITLPGQQSSQVKASDVTGQGQTFTRDAQGNVVAQDVAGFRGKPDEAAADNQQKQINTLRKDITTAGKSFEKIEAARNRITKTGRKATPASDISLIFNFMKMNDPGSTVREGEFATAQNAGGVDTTIVNMYNKLREGTRLTADQREDFITQSEGLFDAQRDAFDSSIERTLQQADQDEIDRVKILGKSRLNDFNERSRLRGLSPIETKRIKFDSQGNLIQ